ncbi:MAG TPA: DivIVA domain-containing protein [Candidatus Nanopelagicales bacterium]
MGLSAQDVHDKQFKLVRQSTGYDIDEVDAFLDEVEAELSRLTAALTEARAAAAPAGHPDNPTDEQAPAGAGSGAVPALGDSAGSAARILELAQRTADEYVAEARRTADGLVHEAQDQARTVIAGLESQRAELEARVAALRAFEVEVRGRLTSYFENQLRDLRSIAERPTG